jgi:short-subunit dehydrogenase
MNKKTVWITGASDGIGAELVKVFSTTEYNVVLSARNEAKLAEVALRNGLSEQNSLIAAFDLSKKNDYTYIVSKIVAKFGTIDLLLLNAGVSQKSFAEETLEEVERNIMETNYFANVSLAKAVLEVMKKQNFGKIAVTSSIIAKFGAPYLSTYSASKAALNNFFESLRFEVEKYKIEILIVTLGFVKTNIAVKALTGDGTAFNTESKAQEKGMDAEKVAKKIKAKIFTTQKHTYIGGLETNVPRFKFLFPNIFYFIWKKLHQL